MFGESQILEIAVLAPLPCGSQELELLMGWVWLLVLCTGREGPQSPFPIQTWGKQEQESWRERQGPKDPSLELQDVLEELECASSPLLGTLPATPEGHKSWAEWLQSNRRQNDPKCRKWKELREVFECSDVLAVGIHGKQTAEVAIEVFILVYTSSFQNLSSFYTWSH